MIAWMFFPKTTSEKPEQTHQQKCQEDQKNVQTKKLAVIDRTYRLLLVSFCFVSFTHHLGFKVRLFLHRLSWDSRSCWTSWRRTLRTDLFIQNPEVFLKRYKQLRPPPKKKTFEINRDPKTRTVFTKNQKHDEHSLVRHPLSRIKPRLGGLVFFCSASRCEMLGLLVCEYDRKFSLATAPIYAF